MPGKDFRAGGHKSKGHLLKHQGPHLSLVPGTLPGREQGSVKGFWEGLVRSPWCSPETLQKSRWGSQCCSGLGLCAWLCPLQGASVATTFSAVTSDAGVGAGGRHGGSRAHVHQDAKLSTLCFCCCRGLTATSRAFCRGSMWPL